MECWRKFSDRVFVQTNGGRDFNEFAIAALILGGFSSAHASLVQCAAAGSKKRHPRPQRHAADARLVISLAGVIANRRLLGLLQR